MKHDHIARRMLVFAVGLLVISLSIGFITKASLGTPPISSIPYSLSLIFPSLTLGNFTILYSLLLVFLQLVILGKTSPPTSTGRGSPACSSDAADSPSASICRSSPTSPWSPETASPTPYP